jgi:hypothetical protein
VWENSTQMLYTLTQYTTRTALVCIAAKLRGAKEAPCMLTCAKAAHVSIMFAIAETLTTYRGGSRNTGSTLVAFDLK